MFMYIKWQIINNLCQRTDLVIYYVELLIFNQNIKESDMNTTITGSNKTGCSNK